MSRRMIIWILIALLLLVVLIIIAKLFFLVGEDYRSPGTFSSYSSSGYYEIDPNKILGMLDQGNTDVFTPFLEDWNRDEPHYDSIVWTQSDYLKIANALSWDVWNEPLDLEIWKVKYVSLSQVCENNPHGFSTFSILYYKALGVTDWERKYTTRLIEMYPWQGLVRWGGDGVFSAPLIPGWDSIDLNNLKITAEDALQIADENGGNKVRATTKKCTIYISISQQGNGMWNVEYFPEDFKVIIDPSTGKHKTLK